MDAIATPRPTLAYEASGSGMPLLLVHGLLSDSRMWARVSDQLAGDYRVIRCDLRGRGRTPRQPGLSPADHVADLAGLTDALGLNCLHLAGYGSGCPSTVGLALRLGRRVRSLTLVDPVIPRSGPRAIQETWHFEMLLQWLTVGHGQVVRRPEHVAALQALVAQQTHAQFSDAPAASGMADRLIPAPAADFSGLAQLACPVMALIGQRAEEELQAVANSMFGQARNFRLRLVPNATRRSPMETPAEVADLLRQFLRSVT